MPLGQGKSSIYRESQEHHPSVILCQSFPLLCWSPTALLSGGFFPSALSILLQQGFTISLSEFAALAAAFSANMARLCRLGPPLSYPSHYLQY